MSTDHRLQDEVLRSWFGEHAVARRLSAVWGVRLGSPDVRRPPDAGQQAGRPAHRVVAWTGHLLVPRLGRTARDQHGDYHDGGHECSEHLNVEHWCFKRLVLFAVTARCPYPRWWCLLIGTPSSSPQFRQSDTHTYTHTHGLSRAFDLKC